MDSNTKVCPMFPSPSRKPQLRVVILDHPKQMLDNDNVKRTFAEIVGSRQTSFHRTLDTYIALDKLDMIGTHFLILDVTEIYHPRILSGIRLTYSKRCGEFGLTLPLDENIQRASLPTQRFYESFKRGKENIAECNGWFVDQNFSFAKTNLDLAQILFFSLTTYLLRQGITSFTGATNERYKGSRWVAKVGPFQDGHLFNHPAVSDPHKVTLVERFYQDWLLECFEKFGALLHARYEMVPDSVLLRPLDEIEAEVRHAAAFTAKISKTS